MVMNWLKENFGRRQEFCAWSAYKAKVDFLEEFGFQQSTRREAISNSPFF